MEVFNNLKIGMKIAISFGLVGVLFLIVIGVYQFTLVKTNSSFNSLITVEEEIKSHASHINIEMLMARRAEKDFLARLDWKYVDRVKLSVNQILEETAELQENAEANSRKDVAEMAKNIRDAIHEYHTAFLSLAESWKEKGLDHNSGLRGEFRGVAHDLEKKINHFLVNDLQISLLRIRKAEKDFILTGSQKQVKKVKSLVNLFRSQLAKSKIEDAKKRQLEKLILEYRQIFNRHSIDAKKETLRRMTKFRNIAYALENVINELSIPYIQGRYLSIRRHEKDYLMRLDKKYIGRLHHVILSIKANVDASLIPEKEKTEIYSYLDTYSEKFDQTVGINDKIKILIEDMRSAVHQIEPLVKKLVEDSNKAMSETVINNNQFMKSQTILVLVVSLVAIVLGVVFAFLIVRLITKPIKAVAEFARKFGEGDMTAELSIDSRDEIGDMSRDLKAAFDNLKDILVKLSTSTNTLSGSSEELSAVSSQMASSAEEMSSQSEMIASASEQVSASVGTVASAAEQASSSVTNIANMTEEMSSTFSNVADSSQKTATKVNQMADSAKEISAGITNVAASVEEMSASLNEVAKNTAQASQISRKANSQSDEVNERMNNLSSASKQIGKIVGVIKDIADQTNMLALNATIEAAGAGEAGKGFAVVAGEVKELAKQSAEASDEIAEQIEQIQKTTTDAVNGIVEIGKIIGEIASINENNASAVEEQTATAGEISRTIAGNAASVEKVAGSASETSNLVNEIAKSINESSRTAGEVARHVDELSKGVRDVAGSGTEAAKGVQEISKNIQGINEAAKQTATGANQTNASSMELSKMAQQLKELVNRFKL